MACVIIRVSAKLGADYSLKHIRALTLMEISSIDVTLHTFPVTLSGEMRLKTSKAGEMHGSFTVPNVSHGLLLTLFETTGMCEICHSSRCH